MRHIGMMLVLLLCAFDLSADDAATNPEIEFLLHAVGQSECIFIRNGKEHSAEGAESHLRLKYRRGKQYAHTAEQFIERLASKSSWSGDIYYIRCGNADRQPSGDWLSARLTEYRNAD